MPGSPLTGQGGQFGGPRYNRGDVPGSGAQGGAGTNANSGQARGRYTSGPEAGLHRGEWQWRGHGPSAQQSYGWDYQGGVGRDEITQRSEARAGSTFQARMAQERSGGLPRGHYAIDYDRGERTGGGRGVSYDWGWEARGGGMPRGGTTQRYSGDYPGGGMQRGAASRPFGATPQRYGSEYGGGGYGASGGSGYGSGNRQGRGGYGRDFGAGHGHEGGGFGGGMRAGGGYGAQRYDRGMQGRMGGGGYGGDYQQPLSDADFYRRVERW